MFNTQRKYIEGKEEGIGIKKAMLILAPNRNGSLLCSFNVAYKGSWGFRVKDRGGGQLKFSNKWSLVSVVHNWDQYMTSGPPRCQQINKLRLLLCTCKSFVFNQNVNINKHMI